MNLKHLTKDVGRIISENSPQILTALGVVGVAATAYLTHKAALEGNEAIFNENTLRGAKNDEGPYLTKRQEIEKIWKLYIPAVTTGVMTVGCIVAANRVQARRMAALAAAYGLLSGDFDEYRNKAAEMLGFKKNDELNNDITKNRIENTNLPPNVVFGDGRSWFYDKASDRTLPSTMETIKSGMNKVNFQCNHQKDATLNDFYDAIGWPQTGVGYILGWNSDKLCDIDFQATLTDTHGAVTSFDFISGPFPNY